MRAFAVACLLPGSRHLLDHDILRVPKVGERVGPQGSSHGVSSQCSAHSLDTPSVRWLGSLVLGDGLYGLRVRLSPSRSATLTVRAEWPLRLRDDGTFSLKWIQSPALVLVPKERPSSARDIRGPMAVHQR